MTTTSAQIILTLGDAEIDSATSSDTHARADIDDLVTGEAARTLKYATYEPDKWLLDGSFHFAQDPAHFGFVSDEISNGSGALNPFPFPSILITLDSVVDIKSGVTIEFSEINENLVNDLHVQYNDVASTPIIGSNFYPDEYIFFCELSANDVKEVLITFFATATPYRLIKILDIYVDGAMWDKKNIKTANIVNEISPVSIESPSGELVFSLYDPSGDFSIVDPQGIYASLEKGQRLDVYELVDDARLHMGRFYLDDWNSKNENIADFQCISPLGKLDEETSYGRTYAPATGWWAEAVMDCIMGYTYGSCNANEASEVEYEIDSSLANVPVSGWLPVQTRREAFQQLAFVIGGYVDDSRSDMVKIKPLKLTDDISSWDFVLGDSEIAVNPNVVQKSQITGVKIIAHTFEKVSYTGGDLNFYSDNVVAGEYLFVPKSDRIFGIGINYLDSTAVIDAGTLEISSNFTKFTVIGAGYLVLDKDTEWIHNTIEYTLNVPNLPANTPENIIVIENATLVNPDNVADVALRLLRYYQQRYAMQTKLFASEIAVGDTAQIDTQSSKQFGGIVERMEIDLTGGFVQKTKTVGAILPYEPDWYGAEYLMLAGGGAGASHALAGGGGAGEFKHGIDLLVKDTVYNIVIGSGGTGSVGGSGANGGDTTFNSHTAHGGGHGGKGSHTSTQADAGADGGCGGGGGGNDSGVGGDGAGGSGYNFPGGQGSNGAPNYGGGGGGGASEIGETGVTSGGGDGESSDITGSDVDYGGGGGGIGQTVSGTGGDGGGGNGNRTGAGAAGTDNLGGGGGSSHPSYAGGDGGEGIFIFRILTTKYSGTITGSPTVSIDGDYTVLSYANNGSYTA